MPLIQHDWFYIKYTGGGTVGAPGIGVQMTRLSVAIRDPEGCHQKYDVLGIGGGVGGGLSFAFPLPPLQGWVGFGTHGDRWVTGFGGAAQIAAAGIDNSAVPDAEETDTSISFAGLQLVFGFARGRRFGGHPRNPRSCAVNLPTGEGFIVGAGVDPIAAMTRSGRVKTDDSWRRI